MTKKVANKNKLKLTGNDLIRAMKHELKIVKGTKLEEETRIRHLTICKEIQDEFEKRLDAGEIKLTYTDVNRAMRYNLELLEGKEKWSDSAVRRRLKEREDRALRALKLK